jgi:regulator of replication initiation timing
VDRESTARQEGVMHHNALLELESRYLQERLAMQSRAEAAREEQDKQLRAVQDLLVQSEAARSSTEAAARERLHKAEVCVCGCRRARVRALSVECVRRDDWLRPCACRVHGCIRGLQSELREVERARGSLQADADNWRVSTRTATAAAAAVQLLPLPMMFEVPSRWCAWCAARDVVSRQSAW